MEKKIVMLFMDYMNKKKISSDRNIFRVEYALLTDAGVGKECNEDSFLINDLMRIDTDEKCLTIKGEFKTKHLNLYCVCDGTTSGGFGSQASQTAVRLIKSYLFDNYDCDIELDIERMIEVVKEVIYIVNYEIYKEFSKEKALGSGSTLAMILFFHNQAVVFNVGDSRIYRLRDDILIQLSQDHTVAEYKRELGIKKDDIYISERDEHTLYQYIGQERTPNVNIYGPFSVVEEDCFFICSDGISSYISREELKENLLKESFSSLEKLRDIAINHGSKDDITGVKIQVRRSV